MLVFFKLLNLQFI